MQPEEFAEWREFVSRSPDGRTPSRSAALLLYYHGPLFAPYDRAYPSQQTSRDLEIQAALLDYLSSPRFDSMILKSRSTVRGVRR